MCTQVSHEGSDMTVYEVGHEMKTLCNILESYDMTPEAVATKTMWLLATVRMIMRAGKKHSINRSTTIRSGNKKKKDGKKAVTVRRKEMFLLAVNASFSF